MINGPLPGMGLSAGPKYLGRPRFPWAAVWAPPTPLYIGLEGKAGFSHQYSFDRGQLTTVTRVVAATADGKPKVILSYMLEALSSKESQMSEPWKSSDAREKMFLMKLRVFETPLQVAAFGWTTVRDIIPPDQDRDFYSPQYVPVREVCTQPECVTWVRKVSSSELLFLALCKICNLIKKVISRPKLKVQKRSPKKVFFWSFPKRHVPRNVHTEVLVRAGFPTHASMGPPMLEEG